MSYISHLLLVDNYIFYSFWHHHHHNDTFVTGLVLGSLDAYHFQKTVNLLRSRFGFIYLWFYWNPPSYVTHSKWARCFLNCYICNYFHEFLLKFIYQTQLSHSRFVQSICSLGLDSFLETCWLLSIPYLRSQLALSHTPSKGWASAVSLTILNSEKIMASFTTSGLWWIVPTWGMKSGLYSRCLKEPGNTGCKCIRGIRWMPLGMKYGSEKELTEFSSFLSLMDCSIAWWFHMTCLEEAAAFSSEAQPVWEHITLHLLSILPYFISPFPLNLAALGLYLPLLVS